MEFFTNMATENPKSKKAGKVTKAKPEKEIKKSPPNKPAVRAKAKKVSATAKPATPATTQMNMGSGEERIEMIRTAAYFISQQRGYQGDYELEDWVEAEMEIDRRIS